jgi:hypothetical protein
MAIDGRIRELGSRKENLERAIEQAMRSPAFDPVRVTELKRQKLKLKESWRRCDRPADGASRRAGPPS